MPRSTPKKSEESLFVLENLLRELIRTQKAATLATLAKLNAAQRKGETDANDYTHAIEAFKVAMSAVEESDLAAIELRHALSPQKAADFLGCSQKELNQYVRELKCDLFDGKIAFSDLLVIRDAMETPKPAPKKRRAAPKKKAATRKK